MKLIIEIPENIIEGAKSSPNYYPIYHFEKMWRAIINGIPLDEIRAEIAAIAVNGQVDEHTLFMRTGEQVKQMALDIIDKYRTERSEDAT